MPFRLGEFVLEKTRFPQEASIYPPGWITRMGYKGSPQREDLLACLIGGLSALKSIPAN